MTWVNKIKISILDEELIFENGVDKVKKIRIHTRDGFIQVDFEENSEWDSEIIPIQNLELIQYKIDTTRETKSYV